jgi:hypothetical protein
MRTRETQAGHVGVPRGVDDPGALGGRRRPSYLAPALSEIVPAGKQYGKDDFSEEQTGRDPVAAVAKQHASRLVGQQRLDHAPLEVGQVVSAHAVAESEFSGMGKPPVGKRPLRSFRECRCSPVSGRGEFPVDPPKTARSVEHVTAISD